MKKNIFKLSKPFTFEGETYTELNMAALEDITGQQLCEAERIYKKQYDTNNTVLIEYTFDFIFILCGIVLNKPIEVFKAMSATDAFSLKYWVSNFLTNGDTEEVKEA